MGPLRAFFGLFIGLLAWLGAGLIGLSIGHVVDNETGAAWLVVFSQVVVALLLFRKVRKEATPEWVAALLMLCGGILVSSSCAVHISA